MYCHIGKIVGPEGVNRNDPRMYAAGLRGGYLEGWVLERGPSVDGACGGSAVFTEATRLQSGGGQRLGVLGLKFLEALLLHRCKKSVKKFKA